jgi:hypothetical protein
MAPFSEQMAWHSRRIRFRFAGKLLRRDAGGGIGEDGELIGAMVHCKMQIAE